MLDPIREDYGTELLCYRGKKCFRVTVNWIPFGPGPGAGLRDRSQEAWALRFRQSHGCLGSLFRVRDDSAALASLRGLVDEIVRAEPVVFASGTWLTERELIALERRGKPPPEGGSASSS
jgi:hypothetical protein